MLANNSVQLAEAPSSMGGSKIVTFPHLVFLSKAAVLISVHPLHMSSKCSGWDWEAVGGAWRKEGGRGERETRKERGTEEKEGREEAVE